MITRMNVRGGGTSRRSVFYFTLPVATSGMIQQSGIAVRARMHRNCQADGQIQAFKMLEVAGDIDGKVATRLRYFTSADYNRLTAAPWTTRQYPFEVHPRIPPHPPPSPHNQGILKSGTSREPSPAGTLHLENLRPEVDRAANIKTPEVGRAAFR
jgi:hypothetical protein